MFRPKREDPKNIRNVLFAYRKPTVKSDPLLRQQGTKLYKWLNPVLFPTGDAKHATTGFFKYSYVAESSAFDAI